MSPTSTPDKLLDTAARLFAERGIYNVSLNEIVRAADQRNASAVHYHFGGREQMLLAILERHVPVLRARRLELLAMARETPDSDLRSVAEAIVRPVTELAQRGWRERAYLQIMTELSHLDRTSAEVHKLLQETAGYEAASLLAERCPPLPPEIWAERLAISFPFIGRAAADRARALGSRSRSRRLLSDEAFVSNLIDMFIGALTAPVSAAQMTRTRSR